MSDHGQTGMQRSFEETPSGLESPIAPPATLARWAAIAGQLATVGHVPAQAPAA
jgi:hypothetical protein